MARLPILGPGDKIAGKQLPGHDAKGDLVGTTAPNTPVRIPVGSDGQILTADSSTSEGVKWSDPTGPTDAQTAANVASGPLTTAALSATLAEVLSGVKNPAALAPYHNIDAATTARKVVVIGDSITDGTLATSYTKTWPHRLQARLRTMLGRTGGVGYVPAANSTPAILPALPLDSSGTAVMWSHGLGGRALYLGEEGHHVTYTTQPCTSVQVHYGKTSLAGGGLLVEIDGVDQGVTLVCSGEVNSGGHIWTSPQLSSGSHVVKVTPFNPPFVGIVEGVTFANGDESSGVRVYNAGHSGGSVAAFTQSSMDLHWESVAAVDPDLVVIALGANDVASATPAEFIAGIDTMVSKVPSGVPVLLVGMYLRGDYATESGSTKWSEMQDGLREMATGRVAYIDLAPHWPELVADGSTSDGLMFDTPPIHPSDAGMDKIATVITAGLSPALGSGIISPQGNSPASFVDAKGDMLVGSADDTLTRVPVGTDGQVLTADSSTSAGVKWSDPTPKKVINPEALGPWWAAVARRTTHPARVCFFGSSTTAGFNATVPANRWVNIFVDLLQERYPSGGAETPVMSLSDGTGSPPAAPGIQGFNGGISATNSGNYIESIAMYAIGVLNPTLVVHMADSNDSPNLAIPPAQTKINLLSKIDAMAATRCHLLIHTYRRAEAGVTVEQWEEYAQVKREIAEERPNVMFLDISGEYERARGATDPFDIIDTDAVHQTDIGHRMMAETIFRYVV